MDPAADFFIWQGGYRDPRTDLGLDYETVELPARDGSTLRGWLVPGASRARPPGSSPCTAAAPTGASSCARFPRSTGAGYPVLLFDCREQGISDGAGRGISLGIRESEDARAAVAWAKRTRGLERVALIGTSQGAASAILAAAADPSIDAVIAENPFTSIRELIRDIGGLQEARPIPPLGRRRRRGLRRLAHGRDRAPGADRRRRGRSRRDRSCCCTARRTRPSPPRTRSASARPRRRARRALDRRGRRALRALQPRARGVGAARGRLPGALARPREGALSERERGRPRRGHRTAVTLRGPCRSPSTPARSRPSAAARSRRTACACASTSGAIRAAAPVVLLHGAFDHGRGFDLLAPLLAERFRVLALTSRGHGDSEWVDSYAWATDVADAVNLLRSLGRPAHLVGHSRGGGQATDAALSRARVRAPPRQHRRLRPAAGGLRAPRRARRSRVPAAALPRATWIAGARRRSASWRAVSLARRSRRAAARAEPAALARVAALLPAPRLAPGRGRLRVEGRSRVRAAASGRGGPSGSARAGKGLRVPMLAVVGTEPRHLAAPEAVASERLAFVPELARAAVAGAGHFVHMERPRETADVLLGFLEP